MNLLRQFLAATLTEAAALVDPKPKVLPLPLGFGLALAAVGGLAIWAVGQHADDAHHVTLPGSIGKTSVVSALSSLVVSVETNRKAIEAVHRALADLQTAQRAEGMPS
jgi:hypothetical protein